MHYLPSPQFNLLQLMIELIGLKPCGARVCLSGISPYLGLFGRGSLHVLCGLSTREPQGEWLAVLSIDSRMLNKERQENDDC